MTRLSTGARACAGLLVLLVCGCQGDGNSGGRASSASAPGPSPRRVAASPGPATGTTGKRAAVLVTVDTLRTDRLGCYGGKSPATPAYDRVAREGALFENAAAVAPLTLPSHASMLTGRYPLQHGVRGNGNFALPAGEPTLATILSEAGFATAAVVGGFPLSIRFGLGHGFGLYDDDFGVMPEPRGGYAPRSERRAREVDEKALGWLASHRGDRFFLWVHYFDPHFEYQPEEPFASRYAGAPYDGEVAATDAALGEILRALDEKGIADSTAVVVVADHGEGLGDHGEAFHGIYLYDSTIRVPLLIRAPGLAPAGSKVRAQVSGVDVAPTILDLLGLSVPGSMTGRSLLGEIRRSTGPPGARPQAAPRIVLSETYGPWLEFRWSPLRAARAEDWKYIEAPEAELYDLSTDPGETENLARTEPARLATAAGGLTREIAALRDARAPRGAPQAEGAGGATAGEAAQRASEETIERLRSLGYTATGAAPTLPPPGGGLRDPKSMRGFEETYYRAIALVNAGRLDEAIASFRGLLDRDPKAPFLRHQLGSALLRAKRLDEAEREFTEALRMAPDLAGAAFDLGNLHELRADRAGAETWYRKALSIDPRSPEAHAALARCRFADGDRAEADREIRTAIALAPSDPVYRRALDDLQRRRR